MSFASNFHRPIDVFFNDLLIDPDKYAELFDNFAFYLMTERLTS